MIKAAPVAAFPLSRVISTVFTSSTYYMLNCTPKILYIRPELGDVMKFIVIVLISMCCFKASGQPLVTLKKYSYQLAGLKTIGNEEKINIATGTCFFIRKQKRLFLVTAKHVLAGCKEDNSKSPNFPDTMHVILHSDSNSNIGNIGFTSKEIADTIDCNKIHENPDFIVLEFEDQIKGVYSVENFLSPSFKEVSSFILYGFPENEMYKDSPHFADATRIYGDQSSDWQITRGNINRKSGVGDTVNYYLFANISLNNLSGFSGSPVFIKERKYHKWRVIGILVASTAPKGQKQILKICRIDYILNEIDSILNN